MGGYFFYLSPSKFLLFLTMTINDYVRGCYIISVKAQAKKFEMDLS